MADGATTEQGFRPEPRAIGNLYGREDAIAALRCAACPAQLTREQVSMWPMETQQEYTVCGLCWGCQIVAFGQDPNECTCSNPCCEADVGVGVITCGSQHCLVHGSGDGGTTDA